MGDRIFPGAHMVRGVWQVPDGWAQGRGVWGGLVVATAVRAAEDAEAAYIAGSGSGAGAGSRAVRAITVQMMAPLAPGEVAVRTSELRRGSATAMWRVGFAADEVGVSAEGVVVLADPRAPDLAGVQGVMPSVTQWREAPVVEIGPPIGPEFAPHLEFRPLAGYPYTGTTDDVVSWIAPRAPRGAQHDSGARYDAGALLGLVDALWPTALIWVTQPRPMATLTFTASLLVDPTTVPVGEPLLHRGRLIAAADGYVTESRELWTADGRLAVHNTQVLAIIR